MKALVYSLAVAYNITFYWHTRFQHSIDLQQFNNSTWKIHAYTVVAETANNLTAALQYYYIMCSRIFISTQSQFNFYKQFVATMDQLPYISICYFHHTCMYASTPWKYMRSIADNAYYLRAKMKHQNSYNLLIFSIVWSAGGVLIIVSTCKIKPTFYL